MKMEAGLSGIYHVKPDFSEIVHGKTVANDGVTKVLTKLYLILKNCSAYLN
jgi:hypothetical protein